MHRFVSLVDREEIEPGAWVQIENTLAKPWVKKMAIMPDVHQGYDLPIGAVVLTDGVISPSFVGFDIGCGMCAMDTGLSIDVLGLYLASDRRDAFGLIKKMIPMGLGGGHAVSQEAPKFESASGDGWLTSEINNLAKAQLGTLGGGNHFIEIGINDNTGNVWITIHSGSRKVGHTVCEYYLGVCSLYKDPKEEKSYLRIDSELGQAYASDMEWAQEFALLNRLKMVRVICDCLGIKWGGNDVLAAALLDDNWKPSEFGGVNGNIINENHNHAEIWSSGEVLHRKGATPAESGKLGIIPGNMRDGVYITRGLGNKKYLNSASHGAGRSMSRGKAKKTLNVSWFREEMAGIVSDAGEHTLDEAPGAYKPIDWVIDKQNGIVVDVISHITPIINIKG